MPRAVAPRRSCTALRAVIISDGLSAGFTIHGGTIIAKEPALRADDSTVGKTLVSPLPLFKHDVFVRQTRVRVRAAFSLLSLQRTMMETLKLFLPSLPFLRESPISDLSHSPRHSVFPVMRIFRTPRLNNAGNAASILGRPPLPILCEFTIPRTRSLRGEINCL